MKEIGGDYLYYQPREVTVETATCGGREREMHKLFHQPADWPIQAPVVINICICKRVLRLGKFGRRFSPENSRVFGFVSLPCVSACAR